MSSVNNGNIQEKGSASCPKSIKGLNIAIICIAAIAVIFSFIMIFALSALSQAISEYGGFSQIASTVLSSSLGTDSTQLSTSAEQAAQASGNLSNSASVDAISVIYQTSFNFLNAFFIISFILSSLVIIFAGFILYFSKHRIKRVLRTAFGWLILAFSFLTFNLPNFVLSIISLVFICKDKNNGKWH